MRIVTKHDFPPIPVRWMDWSAWDADSYDGAEDSHHPVGTGATEQEAITDLMQILNELDTSDEIAAESDPELQAEYEDRMAQRWATQEEP